MQKNFERVSEKILPVKIKNIIWHKTTNIIIINCGKYFEVQRISFKHETIFKREERTEIFNISILDSKEAISVVLIDGTFTIININNGEILFSSSLKKSLNSKNFQMSKFFLKEPETYENYSQQNPFKNNHLVFNSFSKIDVTKVNFFNNDKFSFDTMCLWNKEKREIEIYQKLISSFGTIKLNNQADNIIELFNFENKNTLLYVNKINKNDYDFYLLPLSQLTTYNDHVVNYQIKFAQYILEYISQILTLITRIITKLGIILFDRYSFSNEMQYLITSDNEKEYQNKFNEELKKLFLFGNLSDNLLNFFKNDLFESRSITKMDENIHFNLKNVQDILIENVKPALNQLGYFFNEIKFYKSEIVTQKNLNFLHMGFSELYLSFDKLIESLLEVNFDYRNFLAWINNFNNKENNPNYNAAAKNYLNNISYDYSHCFKFICESHYNMEHILKQIDRENDDNNDINSTGIKKNPEKMKNLFEGNKNEMLQKYINDNKLKDILTEGQIKENLGMKKEKDKKSIKYYLSLIKTTISDISSNLNENFTNNFSSIPQKFFSIKNVQSDITDISLMTNETLDSIFTFTNNDLLKTVLYIIVYNSKTKEFKFSKVSFTYENGVSIIDYKLTKQNELVLLVKSVKVENDLPVTKYSIIVSSLLNYTFTSLNDNNNPNKFDFFNFDSIEDIKIDSFIDVEASDQSFLSIGERRFIALVNNFSNKIIIIYLLPSLN